MTLHDLITLMILPVGISGTNEIQYMLSTEMELLCPSADIHHVGTQKENLDCSGQNTINVHDL